MNPGTARVLVEPGPRRERGRRPDLPAGGRRDRERDRRRLPRRGGPGALHQRAGRLPPHQPRHRCQGAQPTGRRRGPLQETRSRDVRRHRRPRTAAQAPAQRVRRPVRQSADGRGPQARHPRPRAHRHDRQLGGAAMTPPITAAATVSDVTVRFRGHTALDGVSTVIERDSITGLLGRNGAGKTTLMQLLTGHRVPTSGSVEVLGAAPYENEGVLSGICFVEEGQRYPDHFRVRDALDAAALVYPDWDADLAADLLRDFDLPVKRPVKKLSRGMTSAVGIVIGLASRAPVTLFDEPYLGLDAVARQLFYDRLLADYAEHPRTVVLSTHLIEEIAALLERVLLLDRGRVLLDADAESLAGQSRSVVRLTGGSDGGDAADDGLAWEPVTLQQLVVAMSLRTSRPESSSRSDLEEVSR